MPWPSASAAESSSCEIPPLSDSPAAASRYGPTVQRLFSIFPHGTPGAGLLLLRIAVGLTLLVRGSSIFTTSDPTAASLALNILQLIAGTSLAAGFMTPIAGTLAVATALAAAAPLLEVAVVAAALILLGPGAFSIDARLFGRREITIPD